jgi:hypothetical protein
MHQPAPTAALIVQQGLALEVCQCMDQDGMALVPCLHSNVVHHLGDPCSPKQPVCMTMCCCVSVHLAGVWAAEPPRDPPPVWPQQVPAGEGI